LRHNLCGWVIFSVTLFLTVFSPLAYGAVEPWSRKVVGAGILVIILAWLFQWLQHRPVRWAPVPFLSCAILFFLLILFQLLPLPANWRDTFSPATSKNAVISKITSGSLPTSNSGTAISIYPSSTASAALVLAGCILFAVAVYEISLELWRFKALLITLLGLGTFEAVYGLFEYGAGTQRIFWLRKTFYLEEVTGTYINHNHFAGLMEMILPLAIGLFVLQFSARQEPRPESRRRWKILPGNELIGLTVLFALISLMLTALVLSRSRGGLVSFLIAQVCFVFLLIKTRSSFMGIRQINLIFAMLLVLAVAGLSREISTRFSYSARDAPERFELWVDSFRIVRDFPWWGTGLGTYRDVIVNYRPAKDVVIVAGIPQPARVEYAHNDYLQLLVECGLVGFIILVWAMVRTGACLYRGLKESSDLDFQILGWSLVSGLIALVCHGVVDFNFHIPANALIFSLYLALALKLARKKESSPLGQFRS
jgi:O-antigen ligase